MTAMQIPPTPQPSSAWERILQNWQALIAPHRSVSDIVTYRRAQLLNSVTFILAVSFIIGLFSRPNAVATFEFMLGISVVSFILGKTKYPKAGTALFSFGFLSSSYLALYFGVASEYSTSVLAMVPIALIAASALVSQRAFIVLITYAALGAFFAASYSTTTIIGNEVLRTGGVVASIGAVLYGINAFRINLENARTQEITSANRNLQDIQVSLETRAREHVQERQAAQQRIDNQAKQLRTVADISQKISVNITLPLNELLTNTAQMLSAEMGFYHVGIFLLDQNRQYAELRAANSEGGQRMLERRHQLKVGGAGIVGYVAQSGYPRIALSTGADAVFFNNPDLPNTRSEMALPLKVGNLVIGVLDVQSTAPEAFSDEDAHAFGALASQLALAVTQSAGDQLRPADRKAAQTTAQAAHKGYTYQPDGTIAASKAVRNTVLEKALQTSKTIAEPATTGNPQPALAVPVKVRENVIGYIHIEASETHRTWTEDEILMVQAVSERAALALENARLFEASERRAEQEQLMTQVTARIGASTNFERILQTTIQELGQTLKARRAFIQMEPVTADNAPKQGGQP